MNDHSSSQNSAASLANTEIGNGIAIDLYRFESPLMSDRLLGLELLGLRLLGLV